MITERQRSASMSDIYDSSEYFRLLDEPKQSKHHQQRFGKFSIFSSFRRQKSNKQQEHVLTDSDSHTTTLPLMMDEELSSRAPARKIYFVRSDAEFDFTNAAPNVNETMITEVESAFDEPIHNNQYDNHQQQQLLLPKRWGSRINRFFQKKMFKRENKKEETKQQQQQKVEIEAREPDSEDVRMKDFEIQSISPSVQFEVSAKSAFRPIRNPSFSSGVSDAPVPYPTQMLRHSTQEHRHANDHIDYGTQFVRVKTARTATSTIATEESEGYLAVSFDDDCAQLVVPRTLSEDTEETNQSAAMLGVAFPHPASNQPIEEYRLGVKSAHPYFIQKEMEDVWGNVVSDPLDDGQLTNPPSPIMVESTLLGEDYDGQDHPSSSVPTRDGGLVDLFNANIYEPICTFAKDFTTCGQCSDVVEDNVPFDETVMDEQDRANIDANMMILSQVADSGSFAQQYLDEETLSGEGWIEYADSVSELYTSMLAEDERLAMGKVSY